MSMTFDDAMREVALEDDQMKQQAEEIIGFDLGDVVVLRSGSPMMTVLNIEDGQVTVCWFAGYRMRAAQCPEEALVLCPPPSLECCECCGGVVCGGCSDDME